MMQQTVTMSVRHCPTCQTAMDFHPESWTWECPQGHASQPSLVIAMNAPAAGAPPQSFPGPTHTTGAA